MSNQRNKLQFERVIKGNTRSKLEINLLPKKQNQKWNELPKEQTRNRMSYQRSKTRIGTSYQRNKQEIK